MSKLFLCITILLLHGLAAVSFAQDVTARVDGQVADPAGAVVTNATVTLTNTKTGEVRTAQSNDSGQYTLTLIPPGTYDLSVKAQGFKEYLSKGLELSVNDRKTINIPLETGAVSESVTVTAEAPLIQTTPTVGDVVENRRVVELPLNNRHFMQLLTLVPGVSSDGTSEIGIGLTNTVNFSINGTRRNAINFLVDGVSNSDVGSSITLLAIPTVDTIQEFRVLTSVPTAEFGKSGGGVVNLITRGGRREVHGGMGLRSEGAHAATEAALQQLRLSRQWSGNLSGLQQGSTEDLLPVFRGMETHHPRSQSLVGDHRTERPRAARKLLGSRQSEDLRSDNGSSVYEQHHSRRADQPGREELVESVSVAQHSFDSAGSCTESFCSNDSDHSEHAPGNPAHRSQLQFQSSPDRSLHARLVRNE